jgi:hypothetical protein
MTAPGKDYPVFDDSTLTVRWRGKEFHLSKNIFRLMKSLREARYGMSDYDIRLALCNDHMKSGTIERCVRRLRKALKDSPCTELADCIVADNHLHLVKFDISKIKG